MYPSRWKLATYAVVVLLGCLIAAPNLLTHEQLKHLPDWLPAPQITLGLDLKGGSHLVLEIDPVTVLRERLDVLADDVRTLLRDAHIAAARVAKSDDAVVIRLGDGTQRSAVEEVLHGLITTVSVPGFGGPQPNVEIVAGTATEFFVRPTAAALEARTASAIAESREIVQARVDEFGIAEPIIQRLGTDRILVQLPGVRDPQEIKRILVSTAKMTLHLVDTTVDPAALAAGRLPDGTEMVPWQTGEISYPIKQEPLLQGDRLIDANSGFDPRTGQPIVSFRLDSIGAERFADITRTHVGRPFAIVLDGKVLSAPVIREPITGGAGQITGNFAIAEASSLAAMLRAGALPVPLTVMEERTVGPDLGSDAIRVGAITGLIGFALVFAFMIALYGRWGLVANVALIANVVLTLAGLALVAVGLASLAMLAYIWFRFEWTFAVGAIVTLILDVTKTVGFLAITGLDFNLTAIAALLTIIGYSVNDKVVVYDRMRENLRLHAAMPLRELIDLSINQTLARSLYTSATAFLAMLPLAIGGGAAVESFAVPMLFGIVIAASSSIFISPRRSFFFCRGASI